MENQTYGEESIKSFTSLRTWQKAKTFVVRIYKITKHFPEDEKFGLVSQIRRSSVSVTANIAEGFSRNSANDKKHFYSMSKGSLTETLSHLHIAKDLGFIDLKNFKILENECTDINKMLNGMIKSAKGKDAYT